VSPGRGEVEHIGEGGAEREDDIGRRGDVGRTLAVCALLADDHDEMVAKALSWALRELVAHDEAAVRGFLEEHESVLAARVRREVRNKLETGRKNPRRPVAQGGASDLA